MSHEVATSTAYGGDVFEPIYAKADVIDTFVLSNGNWGLWKADSTVSVSRTITPVWDSNDTSQAGTWTTSISLTGAFSSAHLDWDGDGTVEYTLDGTTWTAATKNMVVALGTNPKFDVRVKFAGGIVKDPAEFRSLTVYVLGSDTLESNKGNRTLSFSGDPLTVNGLVADTAVTVNAAPAPEPLPAGEPAPTGSVDLNVGTVELIATLGTGGAAVGGPTGVYYVNGVAGTPAVGSEQHLLFVLDTASNTQFTLGPNITIKHLAVYPQRMTSSEASLVYKSQQGLKLVVNDSGAVTVSEYSPAVDIYAYTWSVVSG